jgi:adenine-specific DNA methylase
MLQREIDHRMLKSHKKTIFETLGRNPIHPFPARMAPGIALDALGEGKNLRVLDPMTGSGTVLAVARANGHRAVGVDIDPLAVLLAGVWTRTVDEKRVNDKAAEVLDRAKAAFGSLPSGRAYPETSDSETRKFIRYWFDDYARRQLAALSTAIRRVHDDMTRDVLWCGFSRLIITKSAGASLAMDLSHSRPHREFTRAPVKPFNRFISAVQTVVSNCPHPGSGTLGPTTLVQRGDARKLNIKTASIDLVLTSPPYLNAIDYMRCSKFSLVWMGHNVGQLRLIREQSVGTEASSEEPKGAVWVKLLIKQLRLKPGLASRDQALLAQYIWDMGQALAEVSRVLRAGGRAVYVVGDSTVRGTFIRNSSIVVAVAAEHGLTLHSRQSRALPANRRYLPPPKRDGSTAALDGRMRREVVLVFNKSAA